MKKYDVIVHVMVNGLDEIGEWNELAARTSQQVLEVADQLDDDPGADAVLESMEWNKGPLSEMAKSCCLSALYAAAGTIKRMHAKLEDGPPADEPEGPHLVVPN